MQSVDKLSDQSLPVAQIISKKGGKSRQDIQSPGNYTDSRIQNKLQRPVNESRKTSSLTQYKNTYGSISRSNVNTAEYGQRKARSKTNDFQNTINKAREEN